MTRYFPRVDPILVSWCVYDLCALKHFTPPFTLLKLLREERPLLERRWRSQRIHNSTTLHVEYAEQRIKDGILFILSSFYECSNLEYEHVPV